MRRSGESTANQGRNHKTFLKNHIERTKENGQPGVIGLVLVGLLTKLVAGLQKK